MLHGYTNTRTEEFIEIAIESFINATNGLRPEGKLPKMAFFASTIEEVTSELKPAVERALLKFGLPVSSILVNVGDSTLTTNDDIREFNQLDSAHSTKQFILLVKVEKAGIAVHFLVLVCLESRNRKYLFCRQQCVVYAR